MGMRIASKRQRAESLRPPLAYAADLLRVCLRDKAIAASLDARDRSKRALHLQG